MFSAEVPASFEREYGSTLAEWRRALPGAAGAGKLEEGGDSLATVTLAEGGRLTLRWTVMPDRRIALARLPCLQVSFRFDDVAPAVRAAFMRHFDLYTQRGGG